MSSRTDKFITCKCRNVCRYKAELNIIDGVVIPWSTTQSMIQWFNHILLPKQQSLHNHPVGSCVRPVHSPSLAHSCGTLCLQPFVTLPTAHVSENFSKHTSLIHYLSFLPYAFSKCMPGHVCKAGNRTSCIIIIITKPNPNPNLNWTVTLSMIGSCIRYFWITDHLIMKQTSHHWVSIILGCLPRHHRTFIMSYSKLQWRDTTKFCRNTLAVRM